MLRYIQHSLHAYAKLALPFLTEAHALVSSLQPVDADARHAELHREHVSGSVSAVKHSGCCSKSEQVFEALCELDALHEAMLLNHVAKRASRAQGVALLTLHVRSFSTLATSGTATKPNTTPLDILPASEDEHEDQSTRTVDELVDRLRIATRHSNCRSQGHLPICFGVLTAALRLSLGAHI